MSRLLKQGLDGLATDDPNVIIPAWVHDRYRHFRAMVLSSDDIFPCYFATNAERARSLRYTYLTRREADTPRPLATALADYLAEHPLLRSRSALLAFVDTASDSDYERAFWHLLAALARLDVSPWPVHVPSDPSDPAWSFCFAGIPVFVAGHAPSYSRRRSRFVPSGILLVIQPRSNLAGIVGHGATAQRVRVRIRKLLTQYDGVPPSRDLNIYGDADSSEWRQYWLADSETVRPARCPFPTRHVTR
jgi:FPC/CPF motif-containing protein YcgG